MSETDVNPSQVPRSPRANVRFTREEYLQLLKEELVTGRTIPQLLKLKYFGKPMFTPALDVETRRAVRREIAYIGNNLNQVAKYFHSGMHDDAKAKFEEVWQGVRILRSFLGLTDGNGENSL